jgi:tripartite-type tricarboxylate transporter receptor subunit TctC
MRESRLARLLATAVFVVSATAASAEWRPERPITMIVPWAPGGTTDQVARILAPELEKELGQPIVIVNQPGATGMIGTRAALDAAPDGYTWLFQAMRLVGTYKILSDSEEADLDDFNLYLAVTNVPVVSVGANQPYDDFGALLQAMKDQPGQISIGTAGPATSGHLAMETIAQGTGVEYRHVTYPGGNPAVISTVAGETVINAELATDQAEMIRAGRLKPLAALTTEPITIAGHGEIPPISNWIEGLPPVATQFGLMIPKTVPAEVTETMDRVWTEVIANSETLKTYTEERDALMTVLSGQEAYDAVWPTVVSSAWVMHSAGMTKMSPDEAGIPRPE